MVQSTAIRLKRCALFHPIYSGVFCLFGVFLLNCVVFLTWTYQQGSRQELHTIFRFLLHLFPAVLVVVLIYFPRER